MAIATQGLLECMEFTGKQENRMRSWTSKSFWSTSTNENKKASQANFRLEWKEEHNQWSNMGGCSQGRVQTILTQKGRLVITQSIPPRGDA
ncbi:hypothetical protein CWR48_02750 [Oceanobacillus arenosus]|uniref:Uncharacterized protein n=1 Tax=Oceanobacillus arenosus TaxID=1229153 RepID=A0A3D8Q0K1_9BACI|nr:hypothetical protein [Oceanobacillus arenosus]RDW21347.1 hypothetical protein CWR48_02750 [Oceanobacillus arenosus]